MWIFGFGEIFLTNNFGFDKYKMYIKSFDFSFKSSLVPTY